ncbi:MAG: flagellar biosynthetic protein FliR [Anaerolineae bacterium]
MMVSFSGLYLEHLFLLFVRILALLASAPVFGHRSVPALVKIGLAGLLAYLLLQVSSGPLAPLPGSLGYFLLLTAHEVFLGLLVGFVATLAIIGLTMAGNLVGTEMGLNIANLFSPLTSEPVAVAGQFYTLLVSLIFLSLGGHHWLILAIAQTLHFAPVGTFQPDARMLADLIPLSATIFVVALRVALPVFGAIVLTDVALALVARAVPQMNVFMVGLPLKVLVALAAMAVTLPLIGPTMDQMLQDGMAQLAAMLAG